MAVDPTVLELFPCSRQDTVSWAQVTLLSVNPTICSQEGNIAHPLLPLCPTWDQKNLPLPQTVPAHSQESVASPARGLEWRLPGKAASEFHFGNMESQHLFLNTPQVPLPAPEPNPWICQAKLGAVPLTGRGKLANGVRISVDKVMERQLPGTQTRERTSRRDWMCSLASCAFPEDPSPRSLCAAPNTQMSPIPLL